MALARLAPHPTGRDFPASAGLTPTVSIQFLAKLNNLAFRQDEWEDVLDADEDWLGLAGSRPPPPPERTMETLLARPDYDSASPWVQLRNNIEIIKQHLDPEHLPGAS